MLSDLIAPADFPRTRYLEEELRSAIPDTPSVEAFQSHRFLKTFGSTHGLHTFEPISKSCGMLEHVALLLLIRQV